MSSTNLKLLILTSGLAILAGCARSSDFSDGGLRANGIVGGTVSSENFQKQNGIVALVINTTARQDYCTGTLVARRVVLTAAHCLSVTAPERIVRVQVVFGTDISFRTMPAFMRDRTRLAVLETLRLHESFDMAAPGPESVDLALLQLNADAPADFRTVTLSTNPALSNPGRRLTQAGFGRTVADNTAADTSFGILRQVSGMEILERSESGGELLVKEDEKGSCGGDSGGPAFATRPGGRLVQVGVNSRGTLEETCIVSGIYTNVTAHLTWIRANIAALSPAAQN